MTFRWELGDGMTAAGPNATVAYRTPGAYNVALVAEDSHGGRGAAFVTVNVPPPNDACGNAQNIQLVGGSTVVVRTGNGGAVQTDPLDPTTCSTATITNSLWFTIT